MNLLQLLERIALVGIGATAVLDGWLWLLARLGVPTLNFAFLGRWVGHVARGRVAHPAIAAAAPVRGELALGWLAHYAIGIGFAAVLLAVAGEDWLRHPTPGIAITVGLGTVLAPLLVMQPAMGAGIASSRTATPLKNVLRSVANHVVFGAGLFLASLALSRWLQ